MCESHDSCLKFQITLIKYGFFLKYSTPQSEQVNHLQDAINKAEGRVKLFSKKFDLYHIVCTNIYVLILTIVILVIIVRLRNYKLFIDQLGHYSFNN